MNILGFKAVGKTGLFAAFIMISSLAIPLQTSAQTNSQSSFQPIAVPQDDASKMILVLSETLIDVLNEQRAELEDNPAKIREFADTYILPYVDAPKMARYIMGRYWKTTTEQQQVAFQKEFTTMLLRSYSQSLLKLKINSVVVKPALEEKPGRVTVSSLVTQADGNKTEVIYRAYLDEKSAKWMVYDFSVEGISMLLNYRTTYLSEFGKRSVDDVIESMRIQNEEFNSRS